MLVVVEREPRSHCRISLALEAIGDKWSLLILRDLIVRGKSRYQDLLNSEERIATNILADRLLRLGQRGLISKADDPDDKRKFRYTPTQKALDLLPVIFEMARWTAKYDPYTDPTNRSSSERRPAKRGTWRRSSLSVLPAATLLGDIPYCEASSDRPRKDREESGNAPDGGQQLSFTATSKTPLSR